MPKIGHNNRLSAIDIRATNKLYCSECGGTFFDEKGYLMSPEYYSKSKHQSFRCEWRITVAEGQQIRFLNKISEIFKSDDCESDYLEVRDGYLRNSPLLGRFCGRSNGVLISSGNRMTIKYVSNHAKDYRGFRAFYNTFSTL